MRVFKALLFHARAFRAALPTLGEPLFPAGTEWLVAL